MAETPWLTYDDFAGRVGEAFDLRLPDGGSVPVVLADATVGAQAGGAGPEGASRLQFALEFRGPAEPLLPQGTYDLRHPQLGELALFLVPVGQDRGGVRYEAVFA